MGFKHVHGLQTILCHLFARATARDHANDHLEHQVARI
jgi:hypothetical protein